MLSFQRDQGSGNLPAGKQTGLGPGGLPGQMDTGEQEFLTVAARPSSLRKSTALVVILFAIGALCLGYMIRKSKPQAAVAAPAADEETEIEIAITRLTGVSSEMLSRMDEIVKKFYEFSDVFQVDVDELAKNPFELELFLSNLRAKLDEQEQKQEISAEEILREKLRQRAASLRLQSVMQSPRGSLYAPRRRELSPAVLCPIPGPCEGRPYRPGGSRSLRAIRAVCFRWGRPVRPGA